MSRGMLEAGHSLAREGQGEGIRKEKQAALGAQRATGAPFGGLLGRLDLPLFLTALVLAIILKILVSEQTITRNLDQVPIDYDLPQDTDIMDPVETMRVTVQGPRDQLDLLTPRNIFVTVRVEDGLKGEVVRDAENFLLNLPRDARDVQAVSYNPRVLVLDLDAVIVADVPIEIRFTGEPAAGARVVNARPYHATARVQGPESRVRLLEEVVAEVDLDRHALSFSQTVTLDTGDPKIQVLEPTRTTISVSMEEP